MWISRELDEEEQRKEMDGLEDGWMTFPRSWLGVLALGVRTWN